MGFIPWLCSGRRTSTEREGGGGLARERAIEFVSLKDISHFDMIALPSSRFTNTRLPLSEAKEPTIMLELWYSHTTGVDTPIKQL